MLRFAWVLAIVEVCLAQTQILQRFPLFPESPVNNVTEDAAGNVYVVGNTARADLPTTPNAFQPTYHAGVCTYSGIATTAHPCEDGYVVKFDKSGSVVYLTYLGGSGDDVPTKILVDTAGNAYITGGTTSLDFPVTPDVFGPKIGEGFIAKLNSSGTGLIYASYLPAFPNVNAIDSVGNLYLAGSTTIPGIATPGAFQTAIVAPENGVPDAFVMKVNPSATALVYATYLGGSNDDETTSIAVDSSGSVFVTGFTRSNDFPTTPGAYDGGYYIGPSDYEGSFITKLNPLGTALMYSARFQGGHSGGIVVDSSGIAYVAGNVVDRNRVPITAGATPEPFSRPVFVSKLSADGKMLLYSTTIGIQSLTSWATQVTVGANGVVNIMGAMSGALPTTPDALQRCPLGQGSPGFIARLDTSTGKMLYATYVNEIAALLETSGSVLVFTVNGTAIGLARLDLTTQQPDGLSCIVNASSNSNASSNQSGGLAPGEFVTLYGLGMGPGSAFAGVVNGENRFDSFLGGVRVLFNGVPAPLLYVQASQINAVVPFEIASSSQTTVQIEYNGNQLAPKTFNVRAAAPAIVTLAGTGYGAILNQDGTLNSADNPAAYGSIISLFATGGGLMDAPLVDGEIVTPPLPALMLPVVVDFFFDTGTILYAGAAPGQIAGVLQINVRIPNASRFDPEGAVAPRAVGIKVGNETSQAVVFYAK